MPEDSRSSPYEYREAAERRWREAAKEEERLNSLLTPARNLIQSLRNGEYEAEGVHVKVTSEESGWHEQRTEKGSAGYDNYERTVRVSELIGGRFTETGVFEWSQTGGIGESLFFNGCRIKEREIEAVTALLTKVKAIQEKGPVSTQRKDRHSSAVDILNRIAGV